MYHKLKKCLNSRSSHQRCSIEKVVLKNFAIFTGKHLFWSLLLIDLQASSPAQVFSCEFAKFLRSLNLTSMIKICEQLLLPFLIFTLNISSLELVSALNSIGLFQRSSSRFKEFSFGCLVVGFSLIPN